MAMAVESVVIRTSSLHCLRSIFGIGKWNSVGCEEESSCGVLGTESWLRRNRGRLTLVLIPLWSKSVFEMMHMSRVWILVCSGW